MREGGPDAGVDTKESADDDTEGALCAEVCAERCDGGPEE